ncbi:hypothetical protein LCGC14_2536770 [marine sediment metagenome]|uniref:HNH endonuclease n=2 Tax=root TaxID=1 RepID=A0A831QN17_9FLAO|nr:hypothetical protein [Pricia antarctica]
MKKIDLTGKRFYRLVVLKEVGKDKWGKFLWLCKCDCGVEKIIIGESFVQGKTQSCGCLGRERRSLANTGNCKGRRFGRLLALRDMGRNKNGSVLWECLCNCGSIITTTTSQLRSGHTKSCGCLNRDKIIEYNKSEKHKKRTAIKNKNRKWTMESRQKSSMSKLNQTKEGWSGFATPTYKRIYKWLKCVVGWYDDVKERDSYTCQSCGDDKGSNLHSHHIISLKTIVEQNKIKSLEDAKQCEILYDLGNGKALCENCHKLIHKQTDTNKYFNIVSIMNPDKRNIMLDFLATEDV